jgi:hypothetical protein
MLLESPRVTNGVLCNKGIINAAREGHLAIVNRLLEFGADSSYGDNAASLKAASRGHLDIVNRLLMDSRVNPLSKDNIAYMSAYSSSHTEVANRLENYNPFAL